MTDKELKRLNRAQLLELLIMQIEENERLREKLEKAEEEINRKEIAINNAGSIAQAALALNKVFEAADMAAQQYLESVRKLVNRGASDGGEDGNKED